MKAKNLLLPAFLLLASLCLHAQNNVDWAGAERFTADSLEQYIEGQRLYPTWEKGTSCIYYNVKGADGAVHHYLFDAKTGKKVEMIKNLKAFARQYSQLTGETIDVSDIKLYGHSFKKGDTSRFYLSKKGKTMVYDINRGLLSLTTQKEQKKKRATVSLTSCHSADSLYSMLGCGYDLYLRNNRTGSVQRITNDGKDEDAYTYRFSKDTIQSNSKGFWLGHHYVCLVQDMSTVKDMALINSLTKKRPTFEVFKMPMPGDAGVRRYRIFWYDADHAKGHALPIDKYPDQVVDLNFFRSPTTLYFTRKSRKADRIDLCRINIADGTVDELISEECKPHINLTMFNYRILENGKYFLWWSERTGRGNYYLYDRNGRLLNRVTRGNNLVAGNIIHVDTLKRNIIFAAYGNEPAINPYYTLFYKASLDGKKQTLLTPMDGNHELTLSDDRRYAVDICSRMDMAPVMSVLSVDNPSKSFKVAQMNISRLKKAGWRPPVLLTVKAADGKTDLCGVMYLPSNLDKSKKYPIISNVYPGPQDDQIPRSFVIDDNGNQSLAELGFVVINMPSRGSSPLRGRDFYTYGYGNLRDYPLADDKNTIEQLARKYSFIDTTRVGIYGHSGGGFQTVAAILTYPDFYKVAVAASGNHDNNIYIQWWGETFHGLNEKTDPKTGKATFSVNIPTNMELAGNLRGRLLLITGDVDKNVPPSSTYRMADALIKAGKRFDMFVLPGKDHGVMCPYYQNLIRYYFVDNLLHPDTDRHTDIINHK